VKYEYITNTGKNEIEVDEKFYEILVEMDNEEFNSDRKNSRRYPVPLETVTISTKSADMDGNIDLQSALASLTVLQRICFTEVCLNGKTERDLSAEIGITHQVINRHIGAARNKLKKIYFR
jgi:DNA-directed RNA polymerase specialized sigma24 family protein